MAYSGPERRAILPEGVDRKDYDVGRVAIKLEKSSWQMDLDEVKFRRIGDEPEEMVKRVRALAMAIRAQRDDSVPTGSEALSYLEDEAIAKLERICLFQDKSSSKAWNSADMSGKVNVISSRLLLYAKNVNLMMLKFITDLWRDLFLK